MLEPEVGAAGECGLDYFRNFSPHEDQERVFRLQLELAAETGKPLFLHQRDAHDAFMAILREYRPRLAAGVAHCFTGDERELRDYLDLDLSIGITGWICDERRGLHLRELVRLIPPRPADDRDGRAVPAAARPAAEAQRPPKRAKIPAAHPAGGRRLSRRVRRKPSPRPRPAMRLRSSASRNTRSTD